MRLFKYAREYGNFLVVGVTEDGVAQGAYLPENDRYEAVKQNILVDYTLKLSESPEHFIKLLKPYIVIKGKEHENSFNPEKEVVDEYGGRLIFSSGDVAFSSIDLLKKEISSIRESFIEHVKSFSDRNSFAINELQSVVSQFSELSVLVIGDTIVDEYITCDPVGMSQEEPTIVVQPVHNEKYLGAAGIVAAHASSLGAEVEFISIVGKDENADFVNQKLKEYRVSPFLLTDESRHTTLKQKFRASGKSLLRVNHFSQVSINSEFQEIIFNKVKERADDVNLLIFSDFNYGCLPQKLVDKIINLCMKKNILIVADSQSSSQIGDVSRFTNMGLITPTEREARLAVHDFDSGLVVVAEKLRKKSKAKNVVLTLGAEGMLIQSSSNENIAGFKTERLPAFNHMPRDVAGAGDSLMVCAALSLAIDGNIWKASYLGAIAAGCQVSRIGNIPIKVSDIFKELK